MPSSELLYIQSSLHTFSTETSAHAMDCVGRNSSSRRLLLRRSHQPVCEI